MSQGPTTARRRLGAELREYRDAAGLTLDQVAEILDCSTSKISRLETGKGLPKQRDIRDLLRLYGKDAERNLDRLLRLARQGATVGWWQKYTALLTAEPFVFDGADRYVALESDANWLSSYDLQTVHGLAQSREYAAAVLRSALPHHSPDERESLLEFRVRRQEVLTRSDAPLRLSLVIDENVFARHVEDARIMAGQCAHLLELAELGNVTIQMLPFASGFSRVTGGGQFVVLGFDESADQDVVFVEGAASTSYLAGDFGVERFKQMFEEAQAAALDPAGTRRWLSARAAELTRV